MLSKRFDIANTHGYEIIAMETDKGHMHFLISYDTIDRVCDIVKIVKQETTYYLWQKYGSFLSKQYWKKRIFWSDGYFAVLENYRQRLYKSILRVRVNG